MLLSMVRRVPFKAVLLSCKALAGAIFARTSISLNQLHQLDAQALFSVSAPATNGREIDLNAN